MCAHNELFTDAQLPEKPSDFLFSYQYASHALSIIDRYKIKGITNTINTACSSSANAIMMGVKLIKSRRVKRAIVGGVDSLSKYTVNGFNALRILSDTPCRPFDENRKGLSLGEGAAYLVLEAEEYVSGKKLYAAVSGFGNANDTFHQSSLSDDAQGVISAMKKAILNAGLSSDDIHYINAHGTGTENNDRVELLGITKIFNSVPPYNSTKSYTGHTLGAAGSMEAVFCIMSLCHNELYKNLNCNETLLPFNCPPIKDYKQNVFIEHVLSNSFGFGGNCASVIFSKT
jgi:3-oxoacyl-(acyl-carrier-protein) synthase